MQSAMMRLLLLLGVCLMGPWAASAQQLWGTLPLPGAAPAARVVADLGGNAGRIDEFLLVDFAHRHYGTATRSQGPETFGRYLTLLDELTTTAAAWPGGFALPAPSAPRDERDRARRFLALLGLILEERTNQAVQGTSREALERQRWLTAAGLDASALRDAINSGAPVSFIIPQAELPLPLPDFWTTRAAGQPVLPALTRSRESSLLYAGLLHLDHETLHYLNNTPAVLDQLHGTHAAVFAAFARAIRVTDGRVRPPGGDAAAPLWEQLVRTPLSDPATFLPALLSVDAGRLAWFYDTVAQLDSERQAWLLGDDARTFYDVFRTITPRWTPGTQPFSRPDVDPVRVLQQVTIEQGRLVAAPWWAPVLERASGIRAIPLQADTLDALWLLRWLYADDNGTATRFQMFQMAQRLAPATPPASAPSLEIVLSALIDVPVLPPALERMGITDLSLMAEVVTAARLFNPKAKGESLARLARWQTLFALVEQTAVRQRLAPERIAPLLRSLAALASATGRSADGLAADWLLDQWVPAMVPDVPRDDLDQFEGRVIHTVMVRPQATPVPVFWEGIQYVADDSFAAFRDALTIRASQSSTALGDIIRLRGLITTLDAGVTDMGTVADVSAEFTRVLAALAKIPHHNDREIKPVADFRRVARAYGDVETARGIPRADKQRPVLRAALDAMVDDAVLSLVYALAVSPAGRAPASLLTMPRQHAWEASGRAQPTAWLPARTEVGPYMNTIIRGSVIGLDVSLADSRLRATAPATAIAVPDVTTVSDDERAVVLRVMRAHADADTWTGETERILAALTAGRTRLLDDVANPSTDRRLLDAGVDPARLAIARWQHERGLPFEQLAFSRLDAYRLGTTAPLPDGWDGIGTEVLLRLLDTTHALDLPDAIVPTLLPLATHDWLRQVQPYAADDTRSMREWSRTLTRERVQEYMLTLVTARLLVRPARTGGRH